mgnify:CR=1 FL=1
MSVEGILRLFQTQMIAFLDELIAQFPMEADLIIIRVFFKDQIPVVDVMNHVIQYVVPHKEKISTKDESFFLEDEKLFSGFSSSKVIHFKRLWMSPHLEKDDKDAIWAWFASFIVLAERYQKALAGRVSLNK